MNRCKVVLMRWILEVSQRSGVTDQATLRVRPCRPLMRQQVKPLNGASIEKSYDVESSLHLVKRGRCGELIRGRSAAYDVN